MTAKMTTEGALPKSLLSDGTFDPAKADAIAEVGFRRATAWLAEMSAALKSELGPRYPDPLEWALLLVGIRRALLGRARVIGIAAAILGRVSPEITETRGEPQQA